jgi:hypothetical protein
MPPPPGQVHEVGVVVHAGPVAVTGRDARSCPRPRPPAAPAPTRPPARAGCGRTRTARADGLGRHGVLVDLGRGQDRGLAVALNTCSQVGWRARHPAAGPSGSGRSARRWALPERGRSSTFRVLLAYMPLDPRRVERPRARMTELVSGWVGVAVGAMTVGPRVGPRGPPQARTSDGQLQRCLVLVRGQSANCCAVPAMWPRAGRLVTSASRRATEAARRATGHERSAANATTGTSAGVTNAWSGCGRSAKRYVT